LVHWCELNLCRSDLEDDYLSDYEDESEDSSSMDGFIVPDDVDVEEDDSGDSEFLDDADTLPLRSRLRPTRLRQRCQRSTCSISVLDSDEEEGNEKEKEKEEEKGRPQ